MCQGGAPQALQPCTGEDNQLPQTINVSLLLVVQQADAT